MKKLLFFIAVMAIFLLPGCKKYPEGPLISFYSATNRITGTWYYEHFYENDIDLVSQLHCDSCFNAISFSADGDGDNILATLNNVSGNNEGRWYLENKEKYISFNFYGTNRTPIGPFLLKGVKIKWRIRRLTQSEFWFTCDFNNKHYEMNLYK